MVSPPAEYADMLTDAGCRVDAWETVYVHELTGEHPVLEWITGTALRPVIDRLSEEAWQQFRQQLIPLLDEAYPARPDGRTFFPFRRVFVVAQVGEPQLAALVEQLDHLRHELVDVGAGGVEHQVGVLRCLVRRVDAGEALEFAGPARVRRGPWDRAARTRRARSTRKPR